MTSLSSITLEDASGKPTSISAYKGKAILIVNVASKCGLTPQYDALQKLYAKYRDKGLVVLGIPSNDFAGQEPGTNAEIQEFCQINYGVEFPVLAKIHVKGQERHPFYQALIAAKPQATRNDDSALEKKLAAKGLASATQEDIQWNFEKFLIGKDGQVKARFAPDIAPDDERIVKAVEKELG